jgi:hypothetical protein
LFLNQYMANYQLIRVINMSFYILIMDLRVNTLVFYQIEEI